MHISAAQGPEVFHVCPGPPPVTETYSQAFMESIYQALVSRPITSIPAITEIRVPTATAACMEHDHPV